MTDTSPECFPRFKVYIFSRGDHTPDFDVELHPEDEALAKAAPLLLARLKEAERFIAGFKDDDLQEGINTMLAAIRAAIAKAGAA